MTPHDRIAQYKPDYIPQLEKLRDNKKNNVALGPLEVYEELPDNCLPWLRGDVSGSRVVSPAGTKHFRYYDGLYQYEIDAANAACSPLSEAQRLRLVKAAKSPTKQNGDKTPKNTALPVITEPLPIPKTPEQQAGAFTVIQFREWSDEYRIRTRIETSNSPPPIPEGRRETVSLSFKGKKKIADSCDYVSRKLGGYKTFLTLTFTAEQRERIEQEETTIQREVSRFCDGLTKMWQRGWQHDGQSEEARAGDLLYCWVAEVPENENGDPNPHVHVLLNWRVEYQLFDAWAARVERLWGCGFAHLEKIKDSDAAAAYMMKAAGYLCKSQGKEDQGDIRGNRYGMSKAARAPEWETVSETQLHIMGRLIADVNQHLSEKYGEHYSKRRALNKKKDEAKKGSRIRYAIGRELQKVREVLKELPIVASQYQVILKGRDAFEHFMSWAKSDYSINNGWLPDKGRGEKYSESERPDTLWYDKFKSLHYWRRSMRKMPKVLEQEWDQLRGWADDLLNLEPVESYVL